MNKVVLSAAAIALATTLGSAVAGDVAMGKAKAATCAGCHGPNGISAVPMYPNLAGQKEQYLVNSLKAYREGKTRIDPTMNAMAKPLSDDDIANLAAYFASLK